MGGGVGLEVAGDGGAGATQGRQRLAPDAGGGEGRDKIVGHRGGGLLGDCHGAFPPGWDRVLAMAGAAQLAGPGMMGTMGAVKR